MKAIGANCNKKIISKHDKRSAQQYYIFNTVENWNCFSSATGRNFATLCHCLKKQALIAECSKHWKVCYFVLVLL